MFLDCTLLTWQLEKSPIGVASLGSNRPRKFVAAMASSTPFGGGVAAANGMVKLTMCIHDHPWFSQGNPRMPWLIMAYHPVKLALNSRRGLATISGAGFSTTHTTAF